LNLSPRKFIVLARYRNDDMALSLRSGRSNKNVVGLPGKQLGKVAASRSTVECRAPEMAFPSLFRLFAEVVAFWR